MSEPGSTTTAPSVSTNDYIKAISFRRSVYPLNDKPTVSDERIVEIVQEILKVTPSSYNTQPQRVAIFLGAQHKKFWQLVRKTAVPLLEGAGPEVVKMMEGRFDLFEAAYGSITFWDSQNAIKASQETHASAAHMFPQFSEHSNGMLQIQVWTAVELEGLGANLQHMQAFPPVEGAVKKEFGLPEDWTLKANMNIGGVFAPHPAVPEKISFDETLKVIS